MITRWITIIGVLLFTSLPLSAQEGLQINSLFDGRFKEDSRAVEVLIKGKELKKYHLTLFRSLTVNSAPEVFDKMEALVKKDAVHAIDKEVGTIGNRLYYGFYCFPPHKGNFRYLFYRNTAVKPHSRKSEATVVYMEGKVTLEELKHIFQ